MGNLFFDTGSGLLLKVKDILKKSKNDTFNVVRKMFYDYIVIINELSTLFLIFNTNKILFHDENFNNFKETEKSLEFET